MAAVTGRDMRSLHSLAVKLARESVFGDELMSSSSPSGKGGAGHLLAQLDVARISQIKGIIRQRASDSSELDFEAIWAKCLST